MDLRRNAAIWILLSLMFVISASGAGKGARKRSTTTVAPTLSSALLTTKKPATVGITTATATTKLTAGQTTYSPATPSTKSPKSNRRKEKERSNTRTARQIGGMYNGYPGSMGMGPMGYGAGSGTAIGTANAAMGQTYSNGNTLADPFGSSRSFSNGQSTGYSPSTSSISSSNSQGFGRRKRQAYGNPMYGGGQGGLYSGGYHGGLPISSSASGIGTANAMQGYARSNGNSFTGNGFGSSNADGMAMGMMPATTSIANSNSQGYGAFGRRKRQAHPNSMMPTYGSGLGGLGGGFGINYPGPGFASGFGTGQALQGQARSMGDSFTGYGVGLSNGQGMMPATTSYGNAATPAFGSFGRRKRQAYGYPGSGYGGSFSPAFGNGFGGGYPNMYMPAASGTGIGTASAMQGTARSNGNSFSGNGFSNSQANGEAMGFNPSTTSIATSNSGGRRKREVKEFTLGGPNDTTSPVHLSEVKTETANTTVGGSMKSNANVPMGGLFSIHPTGTEGEAESDRRARHFPQYGYYLVPMTYMVVPVAASLDYGYGLTLPQSYYQTPVQGGGYIPQPGTQGPSGLYSSPYSTRSNPFSGPAMDAPAFGFSPQQINTWATAGLGSQTSPSTFQFPLSSDFIAATNTAAQSGKGSFSGSVAMSTTKTDGTTTNKKFNFKMPVIFCNNSSAFGCGNTGTSGMNKGMSDRNFLKSGVQNDMTKAPEIVSTESAVSPATSTIQSTEVVSQATTVTAMPTTTWTSTFAPVTLAVATLTA